MAMAVGARAAGELRFPTAVPCGAVRPRSCALPRVTVPRGGGGLPAAATKISAVPRRNVLSTMLSTSTILLLGPRQITLAETTGGAFREYIDIFDGYTFLYPKSWIQVRGAGADIFFRDPFVLDENMSVEISSPSSSKYTSVEDLGPPEKAAEKVNIKSYASNNELAVMPQDRVQSLEWDRRYLSVLGVENKRLYELRLQTPEQVFMQEEDDLRRVMDSFRVIKAA
ncbi:unnamed protein product [Miscanthus lutarioriparius]|uniref:PsbP C-terminal domain-containing protein n=1 Tax=Miscanthus lutarioriparius TaxID=422564 RepID=A0A811RIP4_9POAL|nr:unnamed protein product [Miscanthus lutarioriparius]